MDGSFSKRVKHREDGKLVPDQELIHVWKGGTLNHTAEGASATWDGAWG